MKTAVRLSAIVACLTVFAQETPRPASGGLAERCLEEARHGCRWIPVAGGGGGHRRGVIAAYNRFLPVADPVSGQTVWLCGAWGERPGSPNPPNNGSCYLVRHRDGRYDWGYNTAWIYRSELTEPEHKTRGKPNEPD
jgi:hypothetical protein